MNLSSLVRFLTGTSVIELRYGSKNEFMLCVATILATHLKAFYSAWFDFYRPVM